MTEVLFSAEIPTEDTGSTLTTKEYIVIAICSLCLGLIYIASVFLYIHIKKNKQGISHENDDHTLKEYNGSSQEVTFGAGISATSQSSNPNSSFPSRANTSLRGNLRGSSYRSVGAGPMDELNIVKKNPLLKHFPNLSDNSGFMSDTSNSTLDFDDENILDSKVKILRLLLYYNVLNKIFLLFIIKGEQLRR